MTQLFSIIVILMMSLPPMSLSTFTNLEVDSLTIPSVQAQLSGNNNTIIKLISTSTYTDDLGNFHIIGEVNNTSIQPQNNITVTAILYDTNSSDDSVVGNFTAFSSIGTLRSGELSPFDIVIQNPQLILGKFNFMEFSTTSQSATSEKPSTLVLNGSNSFVDNVGNPHIVGNIINKGQFPEQLLNLATTYYNNSSLGIVGTQSFGLNVANLPNNQMAPFDITIIDNKTKSQAAFYSINIDSVQSSMSPPFNPKFTFNNGGGTTTEQFITGGLSAPLPLINNNQGSNDNDNDNNNSGSSNDGSGGGDLDCEDIDERNFFVGNNDPNGFDGDNDGIGCEAEDLNNNGGDLDCTDLQESNMTVGNSDPNGFDGDNDGIGCETNNNDNNNDTRANDLNCSDIGETNIAVGSNDPNNLDGDNDGIGCETDQRGDDRTNNDESNDNENNNDDSNPCTAEQASHDHTCTSSSGDNDDIDDWTDPPLEEESSDTTSENEDQSSTSEENPNNENENDDSNDNDDEGSDSEESNGEDDGGSNDESNGEENIED